MTVDNFENPAPLFPEEFKEAMLAALRGECGEDARAKAIETTQKLRRIAENALIGLLAAESADKFVDGKSADGESVVALALGAISELAKQRTESEEQ